MKKLIVQKTVQLILLLLAAAGCVAGVILIPGLFHEIANSRSLMIVCGMLLGVLILEFIFMILDLRAYARQSKNFYALNYAVKNDSAPAKNDSAENSGEREKSNMDQLMKEYTGDRGFQKDMAAVLFDLTGLAEIRRQYGRGEADLALRRFRVILKLAAVDRCAIAQNEANQFLAFFESTDRTGLDSFLSRIDEQISETNREDRKFAPLFYVRVIYYHDREFALDFDSLLQILQRRMKETLRGGK